MGVVQGLTGARPAGNGQLVAESGSPDLAVYAASKAALEGFARSLARELGPRGIRVNTLAPGFLKTDLSATLPEEQRARFARRTVLRRLRKPADVAGAIDFLTRDRTRRGDLSLRHRQRLRPRGSVHAAQLPLLYDARQRAR
jgi:NAD(P)-dependent dehydrogenase (short-subunit alcohol dehydrogenase family)